MIVEIVASPSYQTLKQVREKLLEVPLEIVHDGGIRVKLHDERILGVVLKGEVVASPTQEVVLSAVVVVL